MSTTAVSGSAALLSALGQAHAGDTILLSGGVYSNVNINGLNVGGVTIASADPNNMAQINNLILHNSSGITFQNLDFNAAYSSLYYNFEVYDSSNITFSGVRVHGSLDGYAGNESDGLLIFRSNHITIKDSEFQQLTYGINHIDSSYLTFSNNNIHDIGNVGIRGGGSSNVLINNNNFSNIFMHLEPYLHGDAVQFWTAGTTASAHDITITGNTYSRGTGDAVQGIFFRDESGVLPFYNVTISDNVISGALYRGISVEHAVGVTISNNTVQGYSDMKSWISVDSTQNAVLSNNHSTMYMFEGYNSNLSQLGNTTIGYVAPTTAVIEANPITLPAPTPTAPTPTPPPPAPATTVDPSAAKMTSLSVIRWGPMTEVGVSGLATDDDPVTINIYQDGALQKSQQTWGGWSMVADIGAGSHTFTWETVDASGRLTAGAQKLIVGGVGSTYMAGDGGSDVLFGAGAGETIVGNGGNDVFVFAARSDGVRTNGLLASATITDFSPGDKLDLHGFSHMNFGGQSLTVGSNQLTYYFSAGDTYVSADVNGDARADVVLHLIGYHELTNSDVLLS